MRLGLAIVLVVSGWLGVLAGVAALSVPAALIVCGAVSIVIGLLLDYDRGGKRGKTPGPPSRP